LEGLGVKTAALAGLNADEVSWAADWT